MIDAATGCDVEIKQSQAKKQHKPRKDSVLALFTM